MGIRYSGGLRQFSIRQRTIYGPVWTTAADLSSHQELSFFNTTLVATDPQGGTITYAVAGNSSLPSGLSLNANTGVLSGYLEAAPGADVVKHFTLYAEAPSGRTSRQFTLTVVNVPDLPHWQTNAGIIASVNEGATISNVSVVATDTQSRPVTYFISNTGTLPMGISLSNTGVLSGVMPYVPTDITYLFEVTAENEDGAVVRVFSLTDINVPVYPVWTGSTSIHFNERSGVTTTLVATDAQSRSVTYSINTGVLPDGLSLDHNSGVISGNTGAVVTDTLYNVVIDAINFDGSTPQSFTFTILNIPQNPTWVTAAGSLLTQNGGSIVNTAVVASDPQGRQITYTVTSGALPDGVILGANDGTLTGGLPQVVSNTTYSFNILASNEDGNAGNRTFTMRANVTSANLPTWTTPAGSLGSFNENTSVSNTLVATDSLSRAVTYAITAGALPSGLSLNTSTGDITGTLDFVTATHTYSFTVGATNVEGTSYRGFSITVNNVPIAAVWDTPQGSLGSANELTFFSYQLSAHDPQSGRDITYSSRFATGQPGLGLTLSANGMVQGTLNEVNSNSTTTFVAYANLDGIETGRTFTVTAINVPTLPFWNTSPGSLGGGNEGDVFSFDLSASDAKGRTIGYQMANGTTIPSPLFLNTSTGRISGTLPRVTADTTYNFNIRPTNVDGVGPIQSYSIAVTNVPAAPVWNTSTSLFSTGENTNLSIQLSATGSDGIAVTYSSTDTPGWLTTYANGRVIGRTPEVTETTGGSFTVTAGTVEGSTDRTFSYTVTNVPKGPTWANASGTLGTFNEDTDNTIVVVATHPNLPVTYALVSGSLPSGMSLDGFAGTISGHFDRVAASTTYNFTLQAICDEGTTNRAFSIRVNNVARAPIWTNGPQTFSAPEKGLVQYIFGVPSYDVGPITYTVSNSAPSGFSIFDPDNGNLFLIGTPPGLTANVAYNFLVNATTSEGTSSLSFTMNVYNVPTAPTWVTAAGSLGSFNEGSVVNTSVQATGSDGIAVTYSLANATTLPSGLTLNANTGVITGTMPIVSNTTTTTFDVTANSVEGASSRTFSITDTFVPAGKPIWETPASLSFNEHTVTSYALYATNNNDSVYYANTSLLVDFTNTIQDASPLNQSLTLQAMSISNTVTKFGNTGAFSIGAIDNGGSAIQMSNSTVNFGTGDFTIEMFYNQANAASFNNNGTFQNLYSQRESSFSNFSLGLLNANTIVVNYNASNILTYTTASLPINTWRHVAISRVGGTLRMFVDGANVASTAFTSSLTANNPPRIGSDFIGFNTAFSGYMDNIRITKAGRYATDFTPQSADVDSNGIVYSLTSGSLPSGLSLANTGIISGTTSGVTNTATSSFTVNAVSQFGTFATRAFTANVVNIPAAPVWNTSNAAPLFTQNEKTVVNTVVSASGADGITVTYSLASGALPSGVSLLSNGRVTGSLPGITSNTAYSFTINAVTSEGFATRAFTANSINVPTAPVWNTANGSTLFTGSANAVSYQLSATGSDGISVTYTLANATALPTTLALQSNGLITGTLDAVVTNTTTTFDVAASTAEGNTNATFSIINIRPVAAPVWTTPAGSLGSGAESTVFSNTVVATQAYGQTVTYTLANGSALPSGLTLNGNSGLITGTLPRVTANTTTSFTVNATATDGTVSRTFSITDTNANAAPVWNTNSGTIISGNESAAVSTTLSATGSDGVSVTYSLTNSTSLPSGLTLLSNGYVFGSLPRVTANTTTNVTVNAVTAEGFVTRDFSIVDLNVAAAPTWTTPTGSLGSYQSNISVSTAVAAVGSDGITVTYSVTSGSLPGGVSLNANSGAITGTMPTVGVDTTYNFDITASSTEGSTARSFSLTATFVAAAVPSDPFAANVALLVQGEFLGDAENRAYNYNNVVIDYGNVKYGTGSLYFTRTNTSYLQLVANDTSLDLPFDFTIEGWIFIPSLPTGENGFLLTRGGGWGRGFDGYSIQLTPSGTLGFYASSASASYDLFNGTSLGVPALNQWNHFAVTRNGSSSGVAGTWSFYLNGSQTNVNTTTTGSPFSNPFPMTIGNDGNPLVAVSNGQPRGFTGWVDDIRITKGSARYTGTTYTMPSFSFATYTAKDVTQGTAVSNANVAVANATNYTFVGGRMLTGATLLANGVITGTATTTNQSNAVVLRAMANGVATDKRFIYRTNASTAPSWITANTVIVANSAAMYQLEAIDPTGGTVVYTVNTGSLPAGLSLASNGLISGVSTVPSNTSNVVTISAMNSGNVTRNQTITFVTGGAADPYWSNVVALLNGQSGSTSEILSGYSQKTMMINNDGSFGDLNVRANSALAKYGTFSYAMDGTQAGTGWNSPTNPPNVNFGTGDFTFELWVYIKGFNAAATQGRVTLIRLAENGSNGSGFTWWLNGNLGNQNSTTIVSSSLDLYGGFAGTAGYTFGTPVTFNSWNHFAWTRQGSVGRLFLNGVQYGGDINHGTSALNPSINALWSFGSSNGGASAVGALNGYMTDIRVTKGVARYTSAFTPPTAALVPVQDTTPQWVTAAGQLVSVGNTDAINTSVSATTINGALVSYAVTSGALPSGVTLNANTGVITGTTPSVGSPTTYNFTITATSTGGSSGRAFSIFESNAAVYDMLAVGGGGGGGYSSGGGGGGGEVRQTFGVNLAVSNYTVTIGAAGAPFDANGAAVYQINGNSGTNSSVVSSNTTVVWSAGYGGGGASYDNSNNALGHGSNAIGGGGGAGGNGGALGGLSFGSGFPGAAAVNAAGGGGGGAGAAGISAGAGGAGLPSLLANGTIIYYGGGGGANGNPPGAGGLGGGGAGGNTTTTALGVNAVVNSGGGGGGGGFLGTPKRGGFGANGVVALRYQGTPKVGTGSNSTTTTYTLNSITYTSHVFTANSGFSLPLTSDPLWSNVALLVNAESGATGNAALTGMTANTITMFPNQSNVSIVSGGSAKFGTYALSFPGNQPAGSNDLANAAAYASYVANAPVGTNLNTLPWTLEGWFYVTDTTVNQNGPGQGNPGWNSPLVSLDYSLDWKLVAGAQHAAPSAMGFQAIAGGSTQAVTSWACATSFNTWYHLCLQRSGNTLYAFQNGVLLGTFALPANYSFEYNGNLHWNLGGVSAASGYNAAYAGRMDDVRITVGNARYSLTGFIPPGKAPTQ